MYRHKRGAKVCANALLSRQEKLDQVVLDAIAGVLDERILERAVEKAIERARLRQPAANRRADLDRQLAEAETRIQRTLDLLVKLPDLDEEIQARLRVERDRKRALVAELKALKGRRGDVALDVERLRRELRKAVADVRGLLGRNILHTRQILRKLLTEPLLCEAFDDGTRVGYRFTGHGSYAPLVPGKVSTLVVTPAGFEPAISTLKGSRPGPG